MNNLHYKHIWMTIHLAISHIYLLPWIIWDASMNNTVQIYLSSRFQKRVFGCWESLIHLFGDTMRSGLFIASGRLNEGKIKGVCQKFHPSPSRALNEFITREAFFSWFLHSCVYMFSVRIGMIITSYNARHPFTVLIKYVVFCCSV